MSALTLVTDRREHAAPLLHSLEAPVAWRAGLPAAASLASLWSALVAGAPAWTAEIPVCLERPLVSHLLVIGRPCSSPFDWLRRRHAAGPRAFDTGAGLACLSLDAPYFLGQRGRCWVSAPGNLHLSVLVPADLPARTFGAALSMLPAVAVADAVQAVTRNAVRPGIKWVNDLVVGESKIAGVLVATALQGDRIQRVLIGIGLNVAVAPPIAPTPVVPASACLDRATGQPVAFGEVTWQVLRALMARLRRLPLEGPAPLLEDYRRASVVVGRRVRIWSEAGTEGPETKSWPAPIAAGLVTGIGADLSLALEGGRDVVCEGRLALEECCRGLEASGP